MKKHPGPTSEQIAARLRVLRREYDAEKAKADPDLGKLELLGRQLLRLQGEK